MSKSLFWISGWLIAAAAAGSAQEPIPDPQKQEVVSTLETQKITVDFRQTPLSEAIEYFRAATGLNFIVDGDVLQREQAERLTVTLKLKNMPLKSVLKYTLEGKGLTATYKEGALLVLPLEKVRPKTYLRIYDVTDILTPILDFPGPSLELDLANPGPKIVWPEDPKPPLDEDSLIDLIKDGMGRDQWDKNPDATISLLRGRLLVVSADAKMHREVRRMIGVLRQYR